MSSDAPAELRTIRDAYGLEFALLSDPDLELIDAFGLRHEGARPGGGDIARPATYVFDADGRTVERWLPDNWRLRPSADELLAAL